MRRPILPLSGRTEARRALVFVLVALLVGACSSSSTTAASASIIPAIKTSAASPLPSASDTPAPTEPPPVSTPTLAPASFDTSAAAASYLEAAAALNASFRATNAKLPADINNATLAQLKARAAGMAKADKAFQKQVRAIAFPPTMTTLVGLLLVDRKAITAEFLNMVAATSVDEALGYYNKAAALSDSAVKTSAEIRRELGLPPAG